MMQRRPRKGRRLLASSTLVAATALVASSLSLTAPAVAAPGGAELGAYEAAALEEQSVKNKPNTIITQDGEHDDMASMVRYLAMANEFDTKGIVMTSSAAGHHTGGTIRYEPGAEILTQQRAGTNPSKWTESFETAETLHPDGSVASRTYSQNRWTGFRWLDLYLEKYEEVYPNLRVHDPDYPTPEYLESIVKYGNIKVVGEMDEITEGSEWIKKTILENPDGEALYIQHWGGMGTTARALRSIKEQYEGTPDWERIQRKIDDEVTLYLIWGDQAPEYDYYVAPEWPGIRTIMSQDSFFNFYRTWTQDQRHSVATKDAWFRKAWTDTITQIGSPLTSESLIRTPYCLNNANLQDPANKFYTPPVYEAPFTEADEFPFSTWGDGGSCNTQNNGNFDAEGDTGSFLNLVDVGLRNYENPSWGGWAGRFDLSDPARPNEYRDVVERTGSPGGGGAGYTPVVVDVPPAGSTVLPKNWTFSRWVPDIQAAYSVHASWSVTSEYDDANHPPTSAVVNGLDRPVVAGQAVDLHGVASDPDGDDLDVRWWRYADADTHADTGTIEVADTAEAAYTVPADAQVGDTIHLILEVSDAPSNGTYSALKNYKRVVLTVAESVVPSLAVGQEPVADVDGGSEIVLTGEDLFHVDGVTVDGAEVEEWQVGDDGATLRFIAPAHARGTVPVVVTTSAGQVLDEELRYVETPALTGIAPAKVGTAGGDVVTLQGERLRDISEVTVDGSAVSAFEVAADGRSLSFEAPARESAGAVAVVAEGPGGGVESSIEYLLPAASAAAPSRGPAAGGTTVTVTGTGLSSATGVLVGGAPATRVEASSDGTAVTFTTPTGTVGASDVVIQLPGADALLEGAFTYASVSVQVDPGTVRAGSDLRVTASGLAAGEAFEVWLNSEPVLLASGTARADGTVSVTVGVPASVDPGAHRLTVRGALSGEASTPVTVTAAVTGASSLSTTGADLGWLPYAAGLALLAGAAVVITRRVARRG